MLATIFRDPVALAAAQAVAAAAVALAMMLAARRFRVHLERETVVALIRGIVQITAVGSILALLLRGPAWTGAIILAAMVVTAATIASQRARKIPGAFRAVLVGLGGGAGSLIVVMTLLGVIDASIASLLPVASMIIANAMNGAALAMERFAAEVESHAGLVETALALGADPQAAAAPYVQTAIRASLIPGINSLRSLGIVWIPGLMAGMVMSGSSPVPAGIYQFVVIATIFSASGLTALVTTLRIRRAIFSPADQLLLRPGASIV
jgi:putative ABC transport system permease protein